MMHLKARLRPRLLGSALVACVIFAALPSSWVVTSRLLVAWDIGVACYLALAWTMALRSSTAQMQERAAEEDESGIVVLVLTLAASVASLAAIAAELSGLRGVRPGRRPSASRSLPCPSCAPGSSCTPSTPSTMRMNSSPSIWAPRGRPPMW